MRGGEKITEKADVGDGVGRVEEVIEVEYKTLKFLQREMSYTDLKMMKFILLRPQNERSENPEMGNYGSPPHVQADPKFIELPGDPFENLPFQISFLTLR